MITGSADDFGGTDRFSIESRLGAGGFGVVYRAYDRERRNVVAVKALRRAESDALYRFKHEFRSLADISHPNLVALYELLSEKEQWFFTMELVEGVNFLDHVRGMRSRGHAASAAGTQPLPTPKPSIASEAAPDLLRLGLRTPESSESVVVPPFDPHVLRSALRQAVAGIQALHRAGQLHRDIKPSNVLISNEGRVVLLDFGLVTDLSLSGSKRSSSVVGTPAYMSPEQGSSLPLSQSTDWYSLGVMLFEALTGRWPFGGGFIEMMWDKRHKDAPLPSELAPGAPEDLNALCRDLLRRDPRERPTGDEILARLGAVQGATWEPLAAAGASAAIPTPAFVGRQTERSALYSALEATRAPKAVVVRLHGPSGVGKTALVRRFLEEARRENVVALSGRCYERETVPYKALDSLVDALSQYLKRLPPEEAEALLPRDILALARVFPVLRRVGVIASSQRRALEIPDSQELRRRAFSALRELFARLAERRDVVLFLDDLQWGDVDSAALLGDLLRPPDPPPLLLIASYRSDAAAASPFLSSLEVSPGAAETLDVRELRVEALSGSDCRDLARTLLEADLPAPSADTGDAEVEALARESGGNPLFLSELVRYRQAGVELTERDRTEILGVRGAGARSGTLEELIRSRVQLLPEAARRLLEILAVAGQPLRPAVARHAAGLGDEKDAVELLRTRHLIRSRVTRERGEIEPYHDRIRETVVSQLSVEALKAYHGNLAMALEGSSTTDPEALALHFQEAGHAERAAEYSSIAAARAAEALAFDRAARLYRLALELRPAGSPKSRQLLWVKLGDALSNAGHSSAAAHAYLEAVPGAPAADELELRRRAAEHYLTGGHIEEGLATLRTVLEKVGMRMPVGPRGALFSMLVRRFLVRLRGIRYRERNSTQVSLERLTRIDICWSAAKGLILAQPFRARDFQARHLLQALSAGEPYRIARALAVEAGDSATGGGRTRRRTERILEAAKSLSERIGDPYPIGFALSVEGVIAFIEGRWKTARERTQAAGALLRERCRGVAWEIDNANYYSLASLFYLGRIKELRDNLPAVLREAEDRGDLYAATNIRTRLSPLIRLAQDQPTKAREDLEQAIGSWSRQDFYLQHWYELLGQTEARLYADAPAGAWELLDSRWPLLKASLLLHVQSVRINSLHLRARSAIAAAARKGGAGESERFLRLAARDARSIEREAMPWGNALARQLRAGVAASRREPEVASLLEAAGRELDAADMALHATVARRCLGKLIGGEGGRRLVGDADVWMSGQGIQNPERMAAMLAPGSW